VFGDEYRSVQLNRVVLGFPKTANDFVFEENLKYKIMDIIRFNSKSRPSLVFCSTRKSTVSTAEYMANEASFQDPHPFVPKANQQMLIECQGRIADKKLALCVSQGIGFHHGGLEYNDRREVESLFTKGLIKVICTTTTLAVGVNLPAHLVVIKGTSQYDHTSGKVKEYSDHDIMQMIGRAGRPQYDKEGTVVIMTTMNRRDHYTHLISGKELIESKLHESLTEHLNAEVVLGTIKSDSLAMKWLKSTFLYGT
jgi:replicative superfamily II helicase